MGGSASSENTAFDPSQYTSIPISAGNQQRYGDIKAYQHNQTKERIAVLKLIYQDEAHYKQGEQCCKDLAALGEHDSIVRLKDAVTQVNEEFCSTFWNITLIYELSEFDLRQEFAQRLEKRTSYTEAELWHILVSVIAAQCYLKSRNYELSDIRPYNILINEEGKVKVLPRSSFSTGLNCYQEVSFNQQAENGLYLSPAQLKGLQEKQPVPQHNSSKTSVFTLGLSVLECALMKHLPEITDLQNFQINEEALNEALNDVQQIYGDNLYHFLGHMLILDEDQRPDVEDLFTKIEELCQTNLQVADRLYQLREEYAHYQEQSPQPLDQEPQQNQQQQDEQVIDNDQQFEEKPLRSAPQHQHQQQNSDQLQYINEDVNQLREKIIQLSNIHPDLLEDQEEKVKRSKYFANDKAIPTTQFETIIDGFDPRLKQEEIKVEETVKHAQRPVQKYSAQPTTHSPIKEYQFAPEVEKILDEYKTKQKIQEEKINSQLRKSQQQQQSQNILRQSQQQVQDVIVQQQQPPKQVIIQQQQTPQRIYTQQQQQVVASPIVQQQPVQQVIVQRSPVVVSPKSSGIIVQQPVQQVFTTQQQVQQSPQPQQVTLLRASQQQPVGFVRKDYLPANAKIITNEQALQTAGITTVVNQQQ